MTTTHVFDAAYVLADKMREIAGTGKFNAGERRKYTDSKICDEGAAEVADAIRAMCGAMVMLFDDGPEPESSRVANGRARGGHARAASLTAERRVEIARAAAAVRWKGVEGDKPAAPSITPPPTGPTPGPTPGPNGQYIAVARAAHETSTVIFGVEPEPAIPPEPAPRGSENAVLPDGTEIVPSGSLEDRT